MANNRTIIKITDNVLDVTKIYKLYQPNGTNMFVYTDNDGNLHIDGNIVISGTVDGINIFEDVSVNNAKIGYEDILINKLFQPNGTNAFVYTDNDSNLHIDGNIVQNGSTYETHAEQLYTQKDIIITRDGATVGLSTGEYTGIQAKLYDGTNDGQLVFDNTGIVRIGDVGNLQPLATREESPVNGYFAQWDNANNRFKTVQIGFSDLISHPTTLSGYGITDTDLTDLSLYSTSNLSEGSNLYFTDSRVTNNVSVLANTAKVGITTIQANDITDNNRKVSSQWITNTNDDIYYNGGNVGIGTTVPETILHIKKDVANGKGATLTLQNNQYTNSLGASTAIKFKGNLEDYRYAQISSYMDNYSELDRMAFEMYDNMPDGGLHEYITIKYSGKVGIGIQNPSEALDVDGIIKGGHASSDGTLGMTKNITFVDHESYVHDIIIKDGLITSWTVTVP